MRHETTAMPAYGTGATGATFAASPQITMSRTPSFDSAVVPSSDARAGESGARQSESASTPVRARRAITTHLPAP